MNEELASCKGGVIGCPAGINLTEMTALHCYRICPHKICCPICRFALRLVGPLSTVMIGFDHSCCSMQLVGCKIYIVLQQRVKGVSSGSLKIQKFDLIQEQIEAQYYSRYQLCTMQYVQVTSLIDYNWDTFGVSGTFLLQLCQFLQYECFCE